MCRELTPEEHALLVEELLIEQVVRLVGFAEGVEAGIADLLHARANLFGAESVAVTKNVFVFAGSVDEDRGAVEVEAVVARRRTVGSSGQALTEYGPRNAADAEWRLYFVGSDESGLLLLAFVAVDM